MFKGANTDWEAIEASPEFRELIAQKRRYVLPRVILFLGWYVAFVLLAGYAEDFMSERVYEGLTVGYVLALSQFVMVWVLAWTYVREADRDFDPLEQAVIDKTEAGEYALDYRLRSRRCHARDRDGAVMTVFAAVNGEALAIGGFVLLITLGITYWASKRTNSAEDFWAAGRGISGAQNGFAIAGDYMSAASFLGIAGLIFLYGFDGFLYSVGFLVAFLTVLFLLAERMRNAGKFTIADVLAFRLRAEPARVAARPDARRRRLLPDRADGRRRPADRGADRHRLHPRRWSSPAR